MIEGVKTKALRILPDERGRLMEILRCDDDIFRKFGQVYITTVLPGVVKAWHYHRKQTDNIAVVEGMVRFAIYDPRPDSPTRGEIMEYYCGVYNPMLIQVPPHVMHGFKGVSLCEAIVVNCPDEPYDRESPDEHRIDPYVNDIPYSWKRKDG